MTESAQRIAIAEACGWEKITPKRWTGYTDVWNPLCTDSDKVGTKKAYFGYVPNYLSDLNAMHEAEKVLTFYQWQTYANLLIDMKRDSVPPNCYPYETLHATAAQRAEAFLKTLNKWKD